MGVWDDVDELLVDPENEHITHLVMREGHLWGQKDVVYPCLRDRPHRRGYGVSKAEQG